MTYSSRNLTSVQAEEELGELQIRQDTFVCN